MKENIIFNRARDINGHILFADEAREQNIHGYCENLNCGQKLFPKHYSISGKNGFSHYPNHKPCNYMHGEMCEWHYNWQNKARDEYGYTKEDRNKFNGIRIPDTWGFGRVIEFQHSSISLKEIIDRCVDYRHMGFKIDWVFDMTEKIKIPPIILEYTKEHKMGRVFLDYGNKIIELNNEYDNPYSKQLHNGRKTRTHPNHKNLCIIRKIVNLNQIFKPKKLKYIYYPKYTKTCNPSKIEEYYINMYLTEYYNYYTKIKKEYEEIYYQEINTYLNDIIEDSKIKNYIKNFLYNFEEELTFKIILEQYTIFPIQI